MTQPKLTPEQDAALSRRIERLVWAMEDDQRTFFYEQSDALKTVFEGDLRRHFEKMRKTVPPSIQTKYAMEDAAGWVALANGKALMSVATYGVDVDYGLDRDAVLLLAQPVIFNPGNTEDLEDPTERRKIVRAGGRAYRRLKRLWFDSGANVNEIEGLIRLKDGWKKVDARTLLAWSSLYRQEIEVHESVLTSDMPLLRRDRQTIRLVSGVGRMCDRTGEYFEFARSDVGLDSFRDIFTTDFSFLVEVPDERPA